MNEVRADNAPARDYIVIEGVIGAGKTTLAQMLAERFNGKLVLEQFEQNPFLDRFYSDRARWAFHTQLNFLVSRYLQQKDLIEHDLFHQVVVSDYSFHKDRIFAHLILKGDELQLYEQLYSLFQETIPDPDLIVYLQSTPERLLQNIRLRDRPFERKMDPAYIKALNDAYNAYFYRYDRSPLLIIHSAEMDFVQNRDDFDELVRRIMTKRHTSRGNNIQRVACK